MLKFTGEKCICCGEEFHEGDDIVVCPECGTPYHRACWEAQGECLNTELHEQGKSWEPKAVEAEAEKMRCAHCGAENAADSVYCSHCGVALKRDGEPEPDMNSNPNQSRGYTGNYGSYGGQQYGRQFGGGFNPFGFGTGADPYDFYCRSAGIDPNDDIDGVSLKDYFKYVRGNAMYFITKFLRFSKEGIKSSFNFPAFFFPHVYFFFRKMYPQAIIYLTLSVISSIFSNWLMLSVTSGTEISTYADIYNALASKLDNPVILYGVLGVGLVLIVSHVLSGIFANYWYYKKARRDVNEIVGEATEVSSKDNMMLRRGGTSIFYALLAYMAATSGVTLLMNFIY